MRRFEIVTIFNDPAQYAAAAASFDAAGFSAEQARYTPCDNSNDNRFDPYAVIDALGTSADPEPYVIVCHQDVRLDLGDGIGQLDRLIARVEASDPDWAMLGNAGINFQREGRHWLNQPGEQARSAPVPEACMSLDENFLVFHRKRAPRMTPGLTGFHLYGTDAVLNAAIAGRRSYVVPFLLTHLSRGSPESAGFRTACREFEAAWNPRLTVGIINTTCVNFFLSRWRIGRFLISRWRLRDAMARRGITFAPHVWNCVGIGAASSLRLARQIDTP
jgi:hypothetical protein